MKKLSGKTVIISAGGTGGHVYPALAVAKKLVELGAHIEWLGTEEGIESRLVPENQINLNTINIKGIRKKGIRSLIKVPLMLMKSIKQAFNVIKKIKSNHAEVVLFIGFGGFASGPGALAAKMTGIKVILHEQNAAMGLTNRIVSRWANCIILAFPQAMQSAFKKKTYVLGNPIRDELSNTPSPELRIKKSKPFRVLVVGGSLGAKAINEVIPFTVRELLDDIELTHQTGKLSYQSTLDDYQKLGIKDKVKVVEYIDDMANAYQSADLFIGRAGALTVSEVATVGLAAIFVPLPFAVDDHQRKNAQFLADNQAALIVDQEIFKPNVVKEIIRHELSATQLLDKANKAREKSHANALTDIMNRIAEVIYG